MNLQTYRNDAHSEKSNKSSHYLLQADFSVRSSGDTYCAVPTKEFALAEETNKKQV